MSAEVQDDQLESDIALHACVLTGWEDKCRGSGFEFDQNQTEVSSKQHDICLPKHWVAQDAGSIGTSCTWSQVTDTVLRSWFQHDLDGNERCAVGLAAVPQQDRDARRYLTFVW